MKKFILLLSSLIFTSALIANSPDLGDLQMSESDLSGLTMELTTPDFQITKEYLNGEQYDRLQNLPNWGTTGEIGKPELPLLAKIIAIPDQAGIRISYEILETTTLPAINLYPLQEGESDNPKVEKPVFTRDQDFYNSDLFYPQTRVRVSEPVIMRDLRMAQVVFYPFSYNPLKKELEVVKRMRVRVDFTDDASENVKIRRHPGVGSSFAPLYQQIALNYQDLYSEQVEERGGYIFIVPNATYASQIQTLVDWKKEKGFPVDVAQTSIIGTSLENIKNYIQNAYYNWDVPPEFVVLVGDMDGSISIITDHFSCGFSDNAVTDHYYAKLEGNDIFPDIFVGRLSVRSSTELSTVVNKIISYEATPYTAVEWLSRSLMLADISNLSCKLTKQFVKYRCLANGYSQVDTVWFNWNIPTTTVTNSINNGVGIVNFRGYLGWGGWGTSQISALNNVNKTPVVFGCTCETGSFEITTCISESWLRAGTPTALKGGIGCVGPSSWNTHTKWNNCLDSGFAFGLLDEDLEYYMEVINRGKMELWNCFPDNLWGNNTSSVECYFHIYNLIGDPGLSVWTAVPTPLVVDIPGNIPFGSNYYPVSAEYSNGDPVEGAYVNLWKGNEVFVGGYTDENGDINLPINPTTSGAMKVCVTKRNYLPFRQTVQIESGQLFLGVNQVQVDDDNLPPSSGNGDGIINPGETVQLKVQVKNFGSTNVSGVAGTMEIDDPMINILNSSVTYGVVNGGSTNWGDTSFVFAVSPRCPHNRYLEFNLELTDDQAHQWFSVVVQEAQSWDLEARNYQLPQGGTNGLLDPGETSTMSVTLENFGTYASGNATGIIRCNSTFIEILDSIGTFNSINPGGQGSNPVDMFQLHTPITTFPGTTVTLNLALTNISGIYDTTNIIMILGLPDDNDPLMPDEYGYYCYDNSDFTYSAAPIYQWMEVGGLVPHLNLPDYGDEQDCSIRVDFPPTFSFRYYGQTFNSITVCSNGWLSMGATAMCNFRNWPITGAEVAPACIAPFWDDLRMSSSGGTNGKVYAYFDATNHKYIVEWKNVNNADAGFAQECFEVILYDPIYYPTPTGDGIIDFQYQTVVNTGNENNATVGIATPDNGDGVQYTYSNDYPPGAPDLHNIMAIRFTTQGNSIFTPPVIGVNPTSMTINVPENSSASAPLTITNTGGSTLTYSISLTYDGLPGPGDDTGGPDNFGNIWIDSDEIGGPQYGWVDISGIGTTITFVHNDSTTDEMPIGFVFPFYGEEFEEYILSANGWISFSSHASAWSNTMLPNTTAPFDLIAGFWDDLDPLATGAQVLGWSNEVDSLVVSFISVPHWGSSVTGTYTFQWILTADGGITCQYQTLIGNYESCTVGIQNEDGTDGLTVVYNAAYLHPELAVHFEAPFLRVEPQSGVVGQNSSTQVNVYAYSYGLANGTYTATLGIDSNDPLTPHIDVPLSIIIGGIAPAPLALTLTPINPPIIIPPLGGSFNYSVEVDNVSGTTQIFDIWMMVTLPSGSTYGPIMLRENISINPGFSIMRILTQQIPGTAPAGEYYYYSNVGMYPDSIISTDGFNFTKANGEGTGSPFDDWGIWGWEDQESSLPQTFILYEARPNPFNPITSISFDLPYQVQVRVSVVDILGREVAVLQNGVLDAGNHQLRWDAEGLSSGVYFLRLQASDKYNAVKKLLLLK